MEIINGVKMYNNADLAKILGVSEVTVRSYKRAGRLKWVQVRHQRLTSQQNLDAFLQGTTLDQQLANEHVARVLENLK